MKVFQDGAELICIDENTLEPLIAYTLIAYEGGASGRSRLVGGGFSL